MLSQWFSLNQMRCYDCCRTEGRSNQINRNKFGIHNSCGNSSFAHWFLCSFWPLNSLCCPCFNIPVKSYLKSKKLKNDTKNSVGENRITNRGRKKQKITERNEGGKRETSSSAVTYQQKQGRQKLPADIPVPPGLVAKHRLQVLGEAVESCMRTIVETCV